jgi:hypothetical protein
MAKETEPNAVTSGADSTPPEEANEVALPEDATTTMLSAANATLGIVEAVQGGPVGIVMALGAGAVTSEDLSDIATVAGAVPEALGDTTLDSAVQAANNQESIIEQQSNDTEEAKILAEELEDPAVLAARVRFAEQCYLIYHMTELASLHTDSQRNPSSQTLPHYKYNKTLLLDGQGSTLMNKLRLRPGSETLLDATPADLSALVPMIKLSKVVYSESGLIDYEIPFKFLSHTLTDEIEEAELIDKYLEPGAGRTGVGIKSFDWEYISTNPDTIRNDITAKLVLFFQSFDDMITCRKVKTADGRDVGYRYLDLIVHAGAANKCEPFGTSEVLPHEAGIYGTCEDDVPDNLPCDRENRQYDSSKYEVRATVGWASADSEQLGLSVFYNQTNLFLTLLDHSFDIGQDGTFTLTIDYRARLDGLMAGPKSNILLSGGGAGAHNLTAWNSLISVQDEIAELKSSALCADGEAFKEKMTSLKEDLVQLQDELRTMSYQRFCYDLAQPATFYPESGLKDPDGDDPGTPLIYNVPITWEDIVTFVDRNRQPETDGAELKITADEGNALGSLDSGIETDAEGAQPGFWDKALSMTTGLGGSASVGHGTFATGMEEYSSLKNWDPNDDKKTLMQFFFLGDLIDIIATTVFNNTKTNVGSAGAGDEFKRKYCFNEDEVKNVRILLGSLEYRDSKSGETLKINLGDIPISFRMFVDFCQRKIIRKRRQTYSLIEFTRDMIKDLVVRALGAECFGTQGAKAARVRVGFVDGPSVEGADPIEVKAVQQDPTFGPWAAGVGPDPTFNIMAADSKTTTPRLDMDAISYSNPVFDFTSPGKETKDTYQYIVIYTEGPAGLVHPSLTGEDNAVLTDRNMRGIHHLHIGRDRGLVKTIEFSKTDAPYLREARVEKSGQFDPILQLSDVYEVTLKMFGNVFFYPGSYTYINPFGLGSQESLGFPWERGSLSNIMGLGGYHIIMNVSNYIENGVYETTMKARFDSSGDGCRVTSADEDNVSGCDDDPAAAIVGTTQ